jgi:hypothetical protein
VVRPLTVLHPGQGAEVTADATARIVTMTATMVAGGRRSYR